MQITLAGHDNSVQIISLDQIELGQDFPSLWRDRSQTFAVDTLLVGVARGLDVLRERTQEISPYEALGFHGETFTLDFWDRENGTRTWKQWSPGRGSPQEHVTALARGLIVSAMIETGIYARADDPDLRSGVEWEARRLHREISETEPEAVTPAFVVQLVEALAARVESSAMRVRQRPTPSRIDSLFARVGTVYSIPPSPAVHPDTVRKYLALGADPNALVSLGLNSISTPLDRIFTPEAIHLLVEAGADPNGGGIRGTPLASALWGGDVARVETLLALGANPDGVDGLGRSALMVAFLARSRGPADNLSEDEQLEQVFAVMTSLLDAGANPNGRSDLGRTLLHELQSYRGWSGKEPGVLIDLILARGADPTLRDHEGLTADELEVQYRER